MNITEYLENITETKTSCSCGLVFQVEEALDGDLIDKKGYDLNGRFKYWNTKLFKSKLKIEGGIKFGRTTKNATGTTTSLVIRDKRNKKVFTSVRETKVVISNKMNYTQETLDKVLIHELIHVYFDEVKMYDEGHGNNFKKLASEISKHIGFEIPLKDNFSEIDTDVVKPKEVGVIVYEFPHKTNVTFMSVNAYDKHIAEWELATLPKYNLGEVKITHGIAKTLLGDKYPKVRNLKKLALYPISTDDALNMPWVKAEELFL
ncbi:SprT homologues [Tenacibaculum phage pT24]|uniref:SprT homologues n=1 Tax=Tenacibaculum phage pT24 TaxID=1880590 RepID=A0A1B4XWT6_9CAUD|nr:SprT homologues [Tenacibaculum phage pT24]BAV39281.1 SprT homologues [Tenacibaculum phage pT24]